MAKPKKGGKAKKGEGKKKKAAKGPAGAQPRRRGSNSPRVHKKQAAYRKPAKKAKKVAKPKQAAYRKPARSSKKTHKGFDKLSKKAKAQQLELAREEGERSRLALMKVIDALPSVHPALKGHYRVVVNRDATVDAEARITHIPKGLTLNDLLLELEPYLHVPAHQWVSVQLVLQQKAKDEERSPLPRYRGGKRLGIHYQRSRKKALNFLTMRRVLENVERRRYTKPEGVLLRLHWNVSDKKPRR